MPGLTCSTTVARGLAAPGLRVAALVVGLLALSGPAVHAQALVPDDVLARGEAVYRQMCAECHGEAGIDLIDAHGDPLYGDHTAAELAVIIDETMPDGFPEDCTGEDAVAVAAYLHELLYTPEARARNIPPRVELARLTVRQYEHSVADLIGAFTGRGAPGEDRGLQGAYYKSRNTRRNEKAFDRVDPRIDFEFGAGTPDAETIPGAEEFSMRWEGSLLAPETGDYEFCIKTENGSRLWVNDPQAPLIDAWVASGGEVMEHRASRRLLGGRAYPIRLDFFKFKDKTASIELQWRAPGGVWEPIPQRHLAPESVPPTLVVTTPFPADDASAGYERGTAVSKAWNEAATAAAIEVAGAVAARVDRLAGTRADAEDRPAKVRDFCARLAERAFRRPLDDEARRFYVDARFDGAEDLETAVRRSVILILMSPRFLYPEAGPEGVDDHDVASRLALTLWDSLPDDELLRAAAAGELKSPEAVAAQARRMLADPRARAKVQGFFHNWLPFDHTDDMAKDPNAFPGFDGALIADLRTSLELFLQDVVWGEGSDYRQLLLSNALYLNDRLGAFYGVEVPQDGAFHKVEQDAAQRAGVVTHPFLLSALSYHASSSPIHRGVFATRKLLGRALKPPPEAIQFMDGRFDPNMTMREKVAELTSPDNCMGCHSIINPLGFSFENYDAVGRFRTEDKGRPVDATSDYPTADGSTVPLSNARDLAEYAVNSPEAHRGFVLQMFQHLAKQPPEAYGRKTLAKLTESFEASETNIQGLLVEIAGIAALQGVSAADDAQQVARND